MLIHIGYHKTATSWLQKNLFNNHLTGFFSPYDNATLIRSLIYPHPLDFDASECKKDLVRLSAETNTSSVLSLEALSGNPHLGGFNNTEFANRLAAVFPEAKILIIVREQKKIILSNYKQYIKRGGPCSLKSLLNPPTKWQGRAPWFDLDNFKYHRLVNYYSKLFGRSNILVLPYELFISDSQSFINKIIDFSNIEERHDYVSSLPYNTKINSSLSACSVEIKRQFNYIIGSRSHINPAPLFPLQRLDSIITNSLFKLDSKFSNPMNRYVERRLMRIISNKVSNSYQHSNMILNEQNKLDLKKYGYDIGFP